MLNSTKLAHTLRVLMLSTVLGGCASSGGGGIFSGATKFNDFTDDIRVSTTQTLSVKDAMDHYGVNGVTVIGIDNGAVINFEFHGLEDHVTQSQTDENTVYQAASLSKMVVGLGMAQADRTNLVSLDTDVSQHIAQHAGQAVFSWYSREFTDATGRRWAKDVTLRRLLQSAAGMGRPTTGTACIANDTAISTFLGTLTTPCTKCVTCDYAPGTDWAYSSGGYVIAEAMFEEASSRGARNYLNNDVLAPYGFTKSTFKNASTKISSLATGCDGPFMGAQICQCHHQIAKVKFPGGLLANPLEYAQLLILIANNGASYQATQPINLNDIREVIHPAYHKDSSLQACTSNAPACPNAEQCVAGRCLEPLGDEDDWYGMGVHMKPTLASDGYPRELFHSGGQPGFKSYFNIDRVMKDGVVVFVNNSPAAAPDAATKLRNDIKSAFRRHYR